MKPLTAVGSYIYEMTIEQQALVATEIAAVKQADEKWQQTCLTEDAALLADAEALLQKRMRELGFPNEEES